MISVSTILKNKPRGVISIKPSTSVFDALQIMASKNIGSVVVMEDGKYLGILTERDYARKVILKDKTSKNTLVHEIMETNLTVVSLNDSIDHCMELMSRLRVRHLPVLEGETVVGIISIGDVVQAIIEVQKNTIEQLNLYITQ